MAVGWNRHRRRLACAMGIVAAFPLAHLVLRRATRIEPPRVELPTTGAGRAWERVRAGLREVHLEGSPEQIGASNARLVRDGMIEEERTMWGDFERYVPWWIARVGIED